MVYSYKFKCFISCRKQSNHFTVKFNCKQQKIESSNLKIYRLKVNHQIVQCTCWLSFDEQYKQHTVMFLLLGSYLY